MSAPAPAPQASRIRCYAVHAAWLTLLFVVVYGGANWLAAQRAERWRLYADWELAIPLLPGMAWVYLSIELLLFLPALRLAEAQIVALARAATVATLVAGACFVLLPAETGYAREAADARGALGLVRAVDLPHNLVPSLHAAYTVLFAAVVAGVFRSVAARAALACWTAAILASALLTHQHHVADLLSGALLGIIVWSHVYHRPPAHGRTQ